MIPFETLSAPLGEAARNARVQVGHILVFRGLPAMTTLAAQLADLARTVLGDDPEVAHEALAPAELAEAAETVRRETARDAQAHALLDRALAEAGVEGAATYRDPLKLRLQPPEAGAGDSFLVRPLAAHRDTWGSNLMAQTNWWAPVFPIDAARTLALYPGWFRRPIANDSAAWNLVEFLAARREGRAYPLLPLAESPPPPAVAVPIVIEPGDLLCFSGAHLHASVPNTTARSRFSLEVRTVNADEVRAGRGAPNVDGRAPYVTAHWFKNPETGARLGEMAEGPPPLVT